MTTQNFDKINCIGFAIMFGVLSILLFIGGFKGHVWHFYTAVLAAIISVVLFRVVKAEN